MAVREISTRLTLTGENSFTNAIKAMNRNMRLLEAEMQKAEVSFGGADQKTTLLTKKSELLNDKMQQQKNIVAALQQELDQAALAWGDNDQRVDRLRLSLTRAETELVKTSREFDQVGRELRENISPMRRFGNALEDDVEEPARDARDALNDMMQGMRDDIGSIKLSTGFSALRDFGSMIGDLWGNLDGFTSGTRDYRRMMAYLAQNAAAAGEDFTKVKTMMMEVAALTGEMDGAVEGMSNLLAAGYKGDELTKIVNALASAAIRWPDTLKFENLAESLQETLATGKAAGEFGNMIERWNVDLNEFNKALAESETTPGKMQVIAGYLSTFGMDGYYQQFAAENATLLAEAMADLKWQDAMAGLSTEMSKVFTPMKSEMADVIAAWTASLNGDSEDMQKLDKELNDVAELFKQWGNGIDEWVIAAGKSLMDQIISDAEAAMKRAGEILSGSPLTENETNALKTVGQAAINTISKGTSMNVGIQPGNEVEGLLTTIDVLKQWRENRIKQANFGAPIYDNPIGPELPKAMTDSMATAGENAGDAAGKSMAEGIAAQQANIEAAISGIITAVNAEIDKVKPITIKMDDQTGIKPGGGGSGGQLEMVMNLDGERVGRVLAPYVSAQQGKITSLRIKTGKA